MAGKIYVGIGGWTFEPWRGVFYSRGPSRNKLRAGNMPAASSTSIEINGTYYSSFKAGEAGPSGRRRERRTASSSP